MPAEVVPTYLDHEAWVLARLEALDPRSRMVFAAAMAERWFPAVEEFLAAEDWPEGAPLAGILERVWTCVAGVADPRVALAGAVDEVEEATPHMDLVEAPTAMAACVILGEAVEACLGEGAVNPVFGTALSGLHAADPRWDDEDAAPFDELDAIQEETARQRALLERLAGGASLDPAGLAELRAAARGESLRGRGVPYDASPSATPGVTNRWGIDFFSRMVRSDLSAPLGDFLEGYAGVIQRAAVWSARYSRRLAVIDGHEARLADRVGCDAIMARNRARDAAWPDLPPWDEDLTEVLEGGFRYTPGNWQVEAATDPHPHGPSLRALFQQGFDAGGTREAGWEAVIAWGRAAPVDWEDPAASVLAGVPVLDPEVDPAFRTPRVFGPTGDPEAPWKSGEGADAWVVSLGDFPEEPMYRLAVGGEDRGWFHDWPACWRR